MKGFQKPKRLACDMETLTDSFGHFHAQPFERGFGTTFGNALRRILLSSIEGAAITAVRIDGVLHEFSSVTGVREDVTDIIMNLKQIPIKLHVDHAKTIYVDGAGKAGDLKSGDLKPDPDIEILDPDVHIATLNSTANFKMELRVQNGRGYVPADENFSELKENEQDVHYIPLDSVHSPVTRVNFWVESARLGHSTDFDHLHLEVWTDGSMKPQDAVGQAAKILKDHLFIFINFEEEPEPADSRRDEELGSVNENLNKSIEELELSVRSYNCLKNANIQTIGQLVTKSESEMLKTKNFGRKSLNEINEILENLGLSFGMKLDERGRVIRQGAEA
ncbi:MAG TPA: DNA-directed RNA polymerase subunit alpha [Acidobacteriota bacterium]|nr:DNA-directed RNA polymerase subunit alpha [Acidobacteriota bacterium]